jgi:hypothetical protein
VFVLDLLELIGDAVPCRGRLVMRACVPPSELAPRWPISGTDQIRRPEIAKSSFLPSAYVFALRFPLLPDRHGIVGLKPRLRRWKARPADLHPFPGREGDLTSKLGKHVATVHE